MYALVAAAPQFPFVYGFALKKVSNTGMNTIVATIAAIAMGIGSFGWEKGIAIALVFLGVYIVTQSKSRADLEKAEKPH